MPPRYVRRRLSGSTSSPCANPSKLTEEQPSQPFPLLRLSPEILLRISTFWCEHPLGLPTESLNRQLYTVLSDPVAIAQRTLRRFKTVQIGFEYEVLRAESNGDFRATTILLDKGASVHKPPRRELTLSALLSMFLLHDHWILDTPLSRACRYRASKAVKYLLERGADVDGLNFQGVSPIGYASLKGNWEILELLLSLGAQTTQSCLQNAVQAQRVQHVELILEHTSSEILATWEGLGDTHFLLIACQRENIDIVRLLLKYNVPVDSGSTSNNDDDDPINATGLIIACDKGNDSLARLLIEHGADVNVNNGVKNGMTPILAACWDEGRGIGSLVD
ncbi:ankyrin [Gonapodya prolifera JEL478]|uniref:Ankyrin n=1 Tax=Gonapodya prolifera (strain JEL478) TaxID=1344416 RepID=A0A139A1Y8_GONPJ|nr:ankyrin [Gonapodya prolifera JEL478]|eukprot:KXS10754.1 ankyrin [Gonapodya prolifera JEL478]